MAGMVLVMTAHSLFDISIPLRPSGSREVRLVSPVARCAGSFRRPTSVATHVRRHTRRPAAHGIVMHTHRHRGTCTGGSTVQSRTWRCILERNTSAAASRPEREQMGAVESAQHGRKHIFCVNGAADFLALLAELFSEERYNVTTTNYVPETFAKISALQPDLLIIDLVIGAHAGWALLERLAQEATTQGIPVIVTSSD
jgi:CheY-like chemotaxis protein